MSTVLVPLQEAVELANLDGDFYSHYFFTEAFRQESAPFHPRVWDVLEDSDARLVGIKMFRGSAKTTILRSYVSKRIAYGISRTILYIGKSEEAALKSLDWLRRAVSYNTQWTTAFGLAVGDPWSAGQICIQHKTLGYEIRVLAMGITGSIRGVNIDNYRPDLIICDDVMDEENSATAESRKKIKDRLGSLRHSLAPRSDCPDSKFVMLQTPLDEDDAIEEAMNDPQFTTIEIGCFTGNYADSAWPARWTLEELLADKDAHIQRNQLALWMREMEVKVVSSELAHWKGDWLQYYLIFPEPVLHYMGVDPTPPPKDSNKAMSEVATAKLDDAVVMDIGLYKGEIFLNEYYQAKSPNPEEFVNKIFEFYLRHRPRVVTVETTLFQRMLKWYIEQEMKRRQVFMRIQPFEGRQKKETRILQSVSGRASNGTIHVRKDHTAFIEQFTRYPQVAHDDLLDAFSLCLCGINPALESGYLDGEYSVVDEQAPKLPDWRSAP